MRETVNQEGAVMFESLEACLLSGRVNDTRKKYPELDVDLLRIQLAMFACDTVDAAADVMRKSYTGNSDDYVFSQVKVLLRHACHPCNISRS